MNAANVFEAAVRTSYTESHDAAEAETEDEQLQWRQFALVAVAPAAFMSGALICELKQRKLDHTLYRLHGEWGMLAQGDGRKDVSEALDVHAHKRERGPYAGRRVWDKFLDKEWKMRRRFPTPWKVIVLLRILLLKAAKPQPSARRSSAAAWKLNPFL
eukprot:492374-Rhodomonas_salina.1